MSAINKLDEECSDNNRLSLPSCVSNTMENVVDVNNVSYRLESSPNITDSDESEVSLLSLSLDKEIESNMNTIDIDELPAFEIRLISPLGRTPSPIDSEDTTTPTRPLSFTQEQFTSNSCHNNPDYVALHEINAQISPPSDNGDESLLSRTSSLETIFEGVFLNTPPRQRLNIYNNRQNRSRTNILEKVALNRINSGKENQSPLSKSDTNPSQQTCIDISCIRNGCSRNSKYCFS